MFKIRFYLILLSLVIFLVNCSNDDKEFCSSDVSNKLSSIDNVYNCTNSLDNLILAEPSSYIIIEDKIKYDELVTGDCHPEIEFDKYKLIIGSIISENKISSVKYEYTKSCEPNFYKLFVKVTRDLSQLNTDNKIKTFHVLVPKEDQIDFFKLFLIFN